MKISKVVCCVSVALHPQDALDAMRAAYMYTRRRRAWAHLVLPTRATQTFGALHATSREPTLIVPCPLRLSKVALTCPGSHRHVTHVCTDSRRQRLAIGWSARTRPTGQLLLIPWTTVWKRARPAQVGSSRGCPAHTGWRPAPGGGGRRRATPPPRPGGRGPSRRGQPDGSGCVPRACSPTVQWTRRDQYLSQ